MKDLLSSDMILNRMRQATGSESDSELAESLGISQQSVSNARTKKNIPPAWIRFVAEKFYMSADWLLFGTGSMSRRGTGEEASEPGAAYGTWPRAIPPGPASGAAPGSVFETPLPTPDGEIRMIPMVEARLSAGGGSFECSGGVERHYAFRMDFLRRKGQPSEMVLMRVDGDSMAPEIQDGDAVLIDRSQTAPRPGGVYAVSVEDLIYLKVLNAEPGRLILTSYNDAYAPIHVDTRGQLENTVRIIGRVVWLGREFA